MTAMLPPGRGERRTRLYDSWERLIFDSATSDEHPHDFMRSRGLREALALVEFHNVTDHFGNPHRWSGRVVQLSRRRFDNVDHRHYLKHLLTWPTPWWEDDRFKQSTSRYFDQPSSPYTVVDMYGAASTPARWAPVVAPAPPQFGPSGNSPAERAMRAVVDIMPELIAQGLI